MKESTKESMQESVKAVSEPVNEKRKQFIGVTVRNRREVRSKLCFELMAVPINWRAIHYIRLGGEHSIPWLNARWNKSKVEAMLKSSSLVYSFDKGWKGRAHLEFTDVRPAMVRVYKHEDSR